MARTASIILAASAAMAGCGDTRTVDIVVERPEESSGAGSVTEDWPANSIRFDYRAPSGEEGPFEFHGFWDPPGASLYDWPSSGECDNIGDSKNRLTCFLPVASETPEFIFNVRQTRAGFWWGDKSCDPLGGCGNTNGEVVLTGRDGELHYELSPNQAGAPYYNGRLAPVP